MSRDEVLYQTLEALRLRGTVYFQADFRAPWGMAIPASQVAAFHVVVAGRCWLRLADAPSRALDPGDLVLLPHGLAHELVHDEQGWAEPATELLGSPHGEGDGAVYGGTGASTTLVCGHFEYDQRALHPFFESLPEVIHVSAGESEQATWLAAASRLAAAESRVQQQGASVVVDRLAEALLLQTLRLFLKQSHEPRGFLAAAQDPAVGRALLKIHSAPERDWGLDDLASEARLSRSAFSDRFGKLVGESPIRYLSRWRMLSARELLQDPSLSTAAVAARVGYQSEFAFSRAFKRFFGVTPGSARRSA